MFGQAGPGERMLFCKGSGPLWSIGSRRFIGELLLSPWPVAYGMHEGSILSPILFNIYMKTLEKVIQGILHIGDAQHADYT